MRLFLSRHGQVANGTEYVGGDVNLPKKDIVLSPLGLRQAELLAREVAGMGFCGRIVSSPFQRTLLTARPLCRLTGAKIYTEAMLRDIVKEPEWINWFTGRTLNELREAFPEIAEDAVLPYPYWDPTPETEADVAARIIPVLRALLRSGEDVMVFSHGGPLNEAVKYLVSLGERTFSPELPFPYNYNCSLSVFETDGDGLRPLRIFSVSHLPYDMVTSNASCALRNV